MAVFYKLQKTNFKSRESSGKYYAHTVHMGKVSTDEIEKLIEKRCTATRGDVRLVLAELVDVLREELQAGHVVELDGFGRFSLSVRSGCVERPEDFDVRRHVKGLACNFTPTGKRRGLSDRSLQRTFFDGCEVKEAPLYDRDEEANT